MLVIVFLFDSGSPLISLNLSVLIHAEIIVDETSSENSSAFPNLDLNVSNNILVSPLSSFLIAFLFFIFPSFLNIIAICSNITGTSLE